MRKFIKIISAASLMVMFMSLVSCKPTLNEQGLRKNGVLKVGVCVQQHPFVFHEQDGKTLSGFEVELAKEIADIMGVRAEFSVYETSELLTKLSNGKCDIALSGLTIINDRRREAEFSNPYLRQWQVVVMKTGSENPIRKFDQLADKRISVSAGTSSEKLMMNAIEREFSAEVFNRSGTGECFSDLEAGRADAVLCDSAAANNFLAMHPGEFEITWNQSEEPGTQPEEVAIAIAKHNRELVQVVNDAVTDLRLKGRLQELLIKYNIAEWGGLS